MAERKLIKNKGLFSAARRFLVGGVNSPVRSFGYVGGSPVLIKSGQGSKVYDYDGNEYIDYVLSWGAMILGHRHPKVIRELRRQLNLGVSFGTTNAAEIALAEEIKKAVFFIKKVRFVNSGTEAVMSAVRLARGYTGRDKIIKFVNYYHGHADYLLTRGGSGLATLRIPTSAGVPKDFVKHTLVAPFGNKDALNKIFKRYNREIAAVIVEPVGGNYGVIPPDVAYLGILRDITKQYSALLIFDEVITGFRFGFGCAALAFRVTPDLICLGKIIGGGLPIGAFGGEEKIMKLLAPRGRVYQASTFAGNPMVMQAGLATLKILRTFKDKYRMINDLVGYLGLSIQKEADALNIPLKVTHFGSMFSLKFNQARQFGKFYRFMLAHGVYLAPSEFEANFLSFAHTKKDIDRTIEIARQALGKS